MQRDLLLVALIAALGVVGYVVISRQLEDLIGGLGDFFGGLGEGMGDTAAAAGEAIEATKDRAMAAGPGGTYGYEEMVDKGYTQDLGNTTVHVHPSAYAWLASIGYPVYDPDLARQLRELSAQGFM